MPAVISPFLLNKSVTVQKMQPTMDASGGRGETPLNIATAVRCAIQDAPGKVVMEFAQLNTIVTHRIYMTTEYDVKEGHLLIEGTTNYLVKSRRDMGGRDRLFVIYAERK